MPNRNGPGDGTIIIEPVENGWLVIHWTEPEPDEDSDDSDEPDEDDEFDPSAAFAQQQQQSGPQRHVVAHLHMREPQPEPRRYVFPTTEAMLAHVAKLAKATEDQKAESAMKKEAESAMKAKAKKDD